MGYVLNPYAFAAPAGGAITVVQASTMDFSGFGTTSARALPATATAGNTIIAFTQVASSNIASITARTQNGGNLALTQAVSGTDINGNAGGIKCYYRDNLPSGVTGVEFQWSNGDLQRCCVLEVSGLLSSGSLSDTNTGSTANETSPHNHSLTTTGTADQIVFLFHQHFTRDLSAINVGTSGWTAIPAAGATGIASFLLYKIVSATGSQAADFTFATAGASNYLGASFRKA